MYQKFGKGDIALLKNRYGKDFKVKVLECIQDEDGSWWYEVTPLWDSTLRLPNREVPQRSLEVWEEA